jgi:hypothetical protein
MKTSALSLFIIILFLGCANRGNPGGGPVDRIPPEVLFTIPASDSTQVPYQLSEIKIAFSERMDEGSLSRAIFISPPLEYEINWSKGKVLNLELSDSLNSDQTYVVSIGTDASDERSNKLKQSYQFAFSTGQKIDRGSISGRVLGLGRNERAHIFGFPVRDSIEYRLVSSSPKYITQSGTDGGYSLKYLKPDKYRILAVLDQNNNLKLDANYEKVGLPFRDVMLSPDNPSFAQLNFQLSRIDTVPPLLSGVRAINRNCVQLRFSEPVRINSDFAIIDSLKMDTLTVLGITTNSESENIIDVYTANMDSLGNYKAIIHSVADTAGIFNNVEKSIAFLPKMSVDTTHFVINNFFPADSAKNFEPDGTISIEFSNPVRWPSVFERFQLCTVDSQAVKGTWDTKSLMKGEFKPDSPLLPDSSYVVKLEMAGIRNLWDESLEDSTIIHYFTIVSSRELGEISGRIMGFNDKNAAVYLTASSLDRKNISKEIKVDPPGNYLFNYIPEGRYRINGFWDLDNNTSFSRGSLFPFEFADPFFMLDDTIKVRKRWETQDNIIKLPDIE